MGYGLLVRRHLDGEAEVLEIPENGGDSANVLEHLDRWLQEADAASLALVHLNCGLHDIKRAFGSHARQQPLPDYARNLREIVRLLRDRTAARVVWATITPVLDERHHATKGFDRFERDVQAYNATALAVIEECGIPVDDLHAVVHERGVENCLAVDGVHMTDQGNGALADAVAACLRKELARCTESK
jgi:lysophospholipase L1-like esterase